MTHDPLPEKLSDLIDVAVGDLEKCLSMPETFSVNMRFWCSPKISADQKCLVCLAGSVIAQTLNGGEPTKSNTDPWDYSEPVAAKLLALDYVRQFNFQSAIIELTPCDPDALAKCKEIQREFRECAPFNSACPEVFCADMRRAAQRLRAVGL